MRTVYYKLIDSNEILHFRLLVFLVMAPNICSLAVLFTN